ncbi:MAG: hypothetical protein J5865_01975 [Lachnospiraceae bacterium]|nr:hypothetical protein [Lachnospiraceae bacterium]
MTRLVCMTGSAADLAAAELYEQNAALFAEHFPERFLERVRALKGVFVQAGSEANGEELPRSAGKKDGRQAVSIGEGGLWAALWDLGEAAGTGLTVDAAAIPIRQEAVEVCEFLGQDPYALPSSGQVFLLDPRDAADAGQPDFTVIGRTAGAAARTVRIGDRVRYLNRSTR